MHLLWRDDLTFMVINYKQIN